MLSIRYEQVIAVVDWVFLALLLLCSVNGLWQGAYAELLGLVHFVLALFVATVIHVVAIPEVLHHLSQTYFNSNLVYGVSLVVVFICSWLLLKLLFTLLVLLTGPSSSKGPASRIFGAILGAAKGCVLITLAIMAADYTFMKEQDFWKQSWTVEQGTPLTYQVRDGLAYVDEFARENIQQLVQPLVEPYLPTATTPSNE